MSESPWVSEKEASNQLGVNEKTLLYWREIGYLKPGTHWRKLDEGENHSLKPTVLYHLRWSQEVIEYWRDHNAPMTDLVA